MTASPSVLRAELVALTRDDIIDIAKAFAGAIDRHSLLRRHKPVTVLMRGSIDAGKKLVVDTVRESIIGPARECEFSGKHEYDEIWTGEVQGRKTEVSFINLAWRSDYGSRVLRKMETPAEIEYAFGKMRRHGGVSFIQNGRERIDSAADIWVERRGAAGVNGEKSQAKDSKMSEAFLRAHDAGLPSLWLRYVEITVRDPEMLQSPAMADAINRLSVASAKVAEALMDVKRRLPDRPYCAEPKI